MKLRYLLFLVVAIGPFLGCISQSKHNDFPIYLQETPNDCGPICLKMIGEYYGVRLDLDKLRSLSGLSDSTGTSLLGLSEAAESMGLKTLGVEISFDLLVEEMPLPAIVHWNANHFVVVYQADSTRIFVADPASGKVEYSKEEFCRHWLHSADGKKEQGIALLFEVKK